MQKRNCFLVKIKLHIEKIKNNSTIIDNYWLSENIRI